MEGFVGSRGVSGKQVLHLASDAFEAVGTPEQGSGDQGRERERSITGQNVRGTRAACLLASRLPGFLPTLSSSRLLVSSFSVSFSSRFPSQTLALISPLLLSSALLCSPLFPLLSFSFSLHSSLSCPGNQWQQQQSFKQQQQYTCTVMTLFRHFSVTTHVQTFSPTDSKKVHCPPFKQNSGIGQDLACHSLSGRNAAAAAAVVVLLLVTRS